MTQLVPLAIALAIALVGCFVLWLRHRKPTSMESHIDAFARQREALSPDRRLNRGPEASGRGRRR